MCMHVCMCAPTPMLSNHILLSDQSAATVTTTVALRLFSNLTLLSLVTIHFTHCWFFRRIEFNLLSTDWTIYLSKHTSSSLKSLTFISPDACSKEGLLSLSKVLPEGNASHTACIYFIRAIPICSAVKQTTFTATKGHECYGLFHELQFLMI
jgi:hypothetical protein